MRKAFIPESWITSNIKGDALRTLVAVALHADKHGKSWVKNDTLMNMLDKDIRRVQADLNRGEFLGLIDRKFDEKGRRFFVINMYAKSGDEKQHPPAQNDMAENDTPRHKTTGGDDEKQQGGMTNYDTPPNNPHIGTLYSSTVSIHTETHACEEPQGEDTECLSVSNASLPEPEPKQEIPPDVIRMASQLQLEPWIGELKFQNISLADWRVKETLGVVYAKGGKKGSRFAWGVFKNLPIEKPKPEAHTPARQPEPMPNVMPPKREPDNYELVFTEISNRIAAAKWPIDQKSLCMDKLFTVARTGSAEVYRAKLEAIFERVTA